jgi:hypothetical protein
MIKKAFWTGWLVVLWISTAFADGDSRHSTPLEKTFALKVLTAFETALPQGPEGWRKVEKTDLKPPEIVVQVLDQQIRDLTPHDVELKVDLSANVFYQEFVRIPSEQTALEGCPVVRMDHEAHTSQGWHEGTTYVFVGDFRYIQEDNTASMQADEMPGAASTKVRTVVIRVSGEKKRAMGVIKQINLKAIKALLAG